jgi:hypothetical protein
VPTFEDSVSEGVGIDPDVIEFRPFSGVISDSVRVSRLPVANIAWAKSA